MNIKIFFLLIIVFIVITISCNQNAKIQTIIISELRHDSTINIKASKTYPTTLKIDIKGYANDTFMISGFKIKGGNVDTFWHTDWYKKSIIINYQAYKATKGKLTLTCELY
ncbi:MAG: hypothetical protein IT248_02970 [Chitinophagaceae bacterium]|nr:hypothetical protein [Chitinophagaceae bacterium]